LAGQACEICGLFCVPEDAVIDERRHQRLRLLTSRLNKERKKQARQIDILCNDLIAAQKHFVKSLKVIGFAADFYEAIMGLTELNALLDTASNLIKDQVQEANVAFFLIQNNNFEMHIIESEQPTDHEDRRIENFFTPELVDNIAQSNRICTIEDMLTMGLATNPRYLEKVTAVGIPLNHHGSSLGFVLLYRANTSPFGPEEIQSIDHVSAGLARAIAACRALVNIA
jgi:transcriptional regulator with GAF, ATPase, and Fis domain